MLWEIFQYYTTPCLPIAKKMGFLEESIAMAARHKRCRSEWQAHFEQCQKVILNAADQTRSQDTILILGAGSLQDIPLAVLAKRFQRVVLIDLVFLKSARASIQTFPNVEMVEADVSNSLENAYSGYTKQQNYPSPADPSRVSCVVSLNLVTQMPLIPVRWLMQNFGMSEEKVAQYAKEMTQHHLDFLDQFSGVKCLIADREIQEYDRDGKLTDAFDPAWDISLPEPEISWDWEIIPLGEVNEPMRQVNRVGASIW